MSFIAKMLGCISKDEFAELKQAVKELEAKINDLINKYEIMYRYYEDSAADISKIREQIAVLTEIKAKIDEILNKQSSKITEVKKTTRRKKVDSGNQGS